MMGPGFGYEYMGWMMFGSVVFWALFVGLVVWVVLRLTRPAGERSNARAILEERLARGEIDAEEYRTRSALLRA